MVILELIRSHLLRLRRPGSGRPRPGPEEIHLRRETIIARERQVHEDLIRRAMLGLRG